VSVTKHYYGIIVLTKASLAGLICRTRQH